MILIETFLALKTETGEPKKLDQAFIDVILQIAQESKCSSILAPFLYELPFDTIKDQLPLIVIQVKDPFNIGPLIEELDTSLKSDQEKVAEVLYLILKQKFEAQASEDSEQSKRENEAFVKRLTLL